MTSTIPIYCAVLNKPEAMKVSEEMLYFLSDYCRRFVLWKSVWRLLSISIETMAFSLFSKKRKMQMKNKAVEKFLFHGTSHDVVDAICFQNFDFRVCGKNETRYGKGAYFSKYASYSHVYSTADSKGHYYMFLAKVLVGKYVAVGNFFFKKPWHFFLFLNSFSQYTWAATSTCFSQILGHPTSESQNVHKYTQ